MSLFVSGGAVTNSAGVAGLAALREIKFAATIMIPEIIDVNSKPIVCVTRSIAPAPTTLLTKRKGTSPLKPFLP